MGVAIERPAHDRVVIQGRGRQGCGRPRAPSISAIRERPCGCSRACWRASLRFDPDRRCVADAPSDGARRGAAATHGRAISAPMTGARRSLSPAAGRCVAAATNSTSRARRSSRRSCSRACMRRRRPASSSREPSRDHTERMLPAFGVSVARGAATVAVARSGAARAARASTCRAISRRRHSSSWPRLIAGSAPLEILGVGINPTRTGLLDILRLMGADIRLLAEREHGGEPVADLESHPGPLRGIAVPRELVAVAIDEFPVALRGGRGRRRANRRDRRRASCGSRRATASPSWRRHCARSASTRRDTGRTACASAAAVVTGGVVDSHGDHRVAMAIAVLGARAQGSGRRSATSQNVATSFPGFATTARSRRPADRGGRD